MHCILQNRNTLHGREENEGFTVTNEANREYSPTCFRCNDNFNRIVKNTIAVIVPAVTNLLNLIVHGTKQR
ncbi:MAG: hypothetical protein ACLFUC_10255 [Bacteroidales bacterium]